MNAVLDLLTGIAIFAFIAFVFQRQWVFWLLLAILVISQSNHNPFNPYSDYEILYEYDQLYRRR